MAPAKSLTLIAALLAATCLHGQTTAVQFTDPANLRGERVKPRDGRELPIDQGARGLEQMLRKLNTRASLMLIVAHPDDEDGGMLTYYSRGLGARVAVLTLTRGEGGQNAMTGDFEDALGLLRTQELLSADRYLGVDQFFGTEVDFGFSKTKEEAFKKWTHERVLYDAVRSIRLYRPLVIAAVFIGGVTDGHGQHQVSGQIAQEAFKAAADPTVFPDMIAEGILPWQALKVYARVPSYSISDKGLFDYATGKYTAPRFENYVTGEITTTVPSSDVIVHEGTVDPILSDNPSDPPRTYVQFARIGLGMQKSQIGGNVRVPPAGKFDVAYHLYGSALTTNSAPPVRSRHPERSEGPATPPAAALRPEPSSHNPESASFFDGIDTSIEGLTDSIPGAPPSVIDQIKSLDQEVKQLSAANAQGDQSAHLPERLSDALKHVDSLIDVLDISWRGPATVFVISDPTMPSPQTITRPQATIPIQGRANVLHELRVKQVQLNEALRMALGVSEQATVDSDVIVTGTSTPVHIRIDTSSKKHLSSVFVALVPNDEVERVSICPTPTEAPQGDPDHPSARFVVKDCIADESATAQVTRPYFTRTDIEQPVYRLLDQRLRNASLNPPALELYSEFYYEGARVELRTIVKHETQPVQIVPAANLAVQPSTQVLANDRIFSRFQTELHPAQSPAVIPKVVTPKGWSASLITTDVRARGFTFFQLDAPKLPRTTASLAVEAALPNRQLITEGYRPIGYGDLPRTNYYTPATVRIVPVDLNLPVTRKIAYLPGTGDAVPEALASINLKPDILTIADLTPANLAQYDTVILGVRTYAAHPDLHGAPTQALLDYARNGGNVLVQYQSNEFTGADAPFPLALGSNEKVVDETDPVQLLAPTAAFLTTPNKITPADFNNWIEERGHGFLGTWDPHYTALTETHDPDQDPQRGGLITTNLGKGRWTYCAFALYRQLPEAVPGAFRLFVNLIAPVRPRTTN